MATFEKEKSLGARYGTVVKKLARAASTWLHDPTDENKKAMDDADAAFVPVHEEWMEAHKDRRPKLHIVK